MDTTPRVSRGQAVEVSNAKNIFAVFGTRQICGTCESDALQFSECASAHPESVPVTVVAFLEQKKSLYSFLRARLSGAFTSRIRRA